MYDSLSHLSDTLLSMARRSQLETPKAGLDGMDGDTLQLNVPDVPVSDPEQQTSSTMTRRRSNQTPAPVEMPSLGVKTGRTPVNRSKTDEQFEERCQGCQGALYCQLVPDPAVKRKGQGADRRVRRMCYWCDSRTDYFCFGCRRYLCFARPKYKSGDKKDTKQPKYLTVSTPDLRKSSSVSDTIKDVGIYTCYHAAHREAWNEHATSNRAAILRAGREEQGEPAVAAGPEIIVKRAKQRKSRRISASSS